MDHSDPATPETSVEAQDTSNRRKSGRTRHKPVLLQQDPNVTQSTRAGSAKRKLADFRDEDGNGEDGDTDEDSEQSESDPDEEEVKERKKKATRKVASKPAPKKSRPNDIASKSLPVRPAVNGVKKAAKPRKAPPRLSGLGDLGSGLYGMRFLHSHKFAHSLNLHAAEVFGRKKDLDEVAADWIQYWGRNQTEAMCAFVNFAIKCTGCPLQVDIHDIEDPDNVVSKLTDLQDEYQAQKPAEYPLVSKAKSQSSFRPMMIEFIETFITACHAAGLLYSDLQIIENIEIWVSTMTSSSIRPFRHTSTLISLTISNSLCKIAAETSENLAKISRQKEGEQKKKRVNEARVKDLDKSVADLDRRLTQLKEMLLGMFDTVFVHRYRDVDPRIRLECVTALGDWIITLPDVFFEGIYLRYLGWVLSDSSAPTRAEVIKQLLKLYKNKSNVARLRTFTDRFRARILEMAMQDADLTIRVSAIELLEMIRETELLEPDDIDNVGGLIFDSEPRIRKAVAGFFSENINDLYETTLDDFGGQEGLIETLGEEVEDEYDTPRATWLKLKCMAEILHTYDSQDSGSVTLQRNIDKSNSGADSRLAMAAHNIYEAVPEVRNWEVLAGYLLYDFSQIGRAADVSNTAFKKRCHLDEKEEIFMLELLDVAVKRSVQEAVENEQDKKGKKTAKQREESRKAQASMALQLARTIPKLLKKFGSNPTTASPVLALGSIMNLDIFQEMRENSTLYASLLDDINKQFLSHGNQEVLTEASNALLHAQEYEDLNEVTESKIQELWSDTIQHLRTSIASGITEGLNDLCDTVNRMAALSNVISCVEVFDKVGRPSSKRKANKITTAPPLDLLVELIEEPALDQAAGEEAVEILTAAIKSVRSYYMWITVSLQAEVDVNKPPSSLPDYSAFVRALSFVASAWPSGSKIRQLACACILDVHTLFARFRHSPNTNLIINSVSEDAVPLILQTFVSLEKHYARIARKKVESGPANVDAAPESDPEEELESDSDEDQEDDGGVVATTAEQRRMKVLVAEEALCRFTYSMMLAILAKVLDTPSEGQKQGRIRQRIQRNRFKLGGAFKETLAQMDDKPVTTRGGGASKKGKRNTKPTEKAPSTAAAATATATESHARAESKNHKSAATVQDEDAGSDAEGEEDAEQRELVDDQIIDEPDDEAADESAGDQDQESGEDEIMGD